MPLYVHLCNNEECQEITEVLCPVSKRKKKIRCPVCGDWAERQYARPGESPGAIFKGFGWYTNKSRDRKYAEKGMDKQEANRFLEQEIRNSQKRMESGGQHYKRMVPNYKNLHKQGVVKQVSDKEAIRKREASKKMTEEAYKKAGLDPTKPSTPQPI